ncbi:MAG: oxidoreductase [Rhodospirillaceae bacterium]|nr:oxidoreductase [Rhodospirillaceae bacterium]
MENDFRALLLEKSEDGVSASIKQLKEEQLPEGDVTVSISYSTLNYKDGMILKGVGVLVRNYPHIPGIDFVGRVERSEASEYSVGDKVILTGWRVGEARWGGFSEKARVQSGWLVPLPKELTEKRAMAIGTAGLTAMLAVLEFQSNGLLPQNGPVLVTGANGGVGSVAISLLAGYGYEVHASTGRLDLSDDLKSIGASEIIAREELNAVPERPLLSERWAGVVDTVGGDTLATVLPQIKSRGVVAACGNAGGIKFSSTVIPFLLRGIKLSGIDSAMCPTGQRKKAWERLSEDLSTTALDGLTTTISLDDLPEFAGKILKGKIKGRTIVDVNA